MKKCTICKQEKDLDQFNKKTTSKDGLQSLCKTCSREKFKRYYDDNTKKHKAIAIESSKRHRRLAREYLNEVKTENGCALCPEKTPCCIDFHHLSDKEFLLSSRTKTSITTINKELAKCVCLCANCHRKVHAQILSVDVSHTCKIPSR